MRHSNSYRSVRRAIHRSRRLARNTALAVSSAVSTASVNSVAA